MCSRSHRCSQAHRPAALLFRFICFWEPNTSKTSIFEHLGNASVRQHWYRNLNPTLIACCVPCVVSDCCLGMVMRQVSYSMLNARVLCKASILERSFRLADMLCIWVRIRSGNGNYKLCTAVVGILKVPLDKSLRTALRVAPMPLDAKEAGALTRCHLRHQSVGKEEPMDNMTYSRSTRYELRGNFVQGIDTVSSACLFASLVRRPYDCSVLFPCPFLISRSISYCTGYQLPNLRAPGSTFLRIP